MHERTKPGCYIVGEGNDGTGKSTQIKLLADYISTELQREVYIMEEPDGSPISSEIRKIIKNGSLGRSAITNLLLFTASRYETWHTEALPVLQRGGVVLSARNELSSEVYQGIAEGLGTDYVRKVTSEFMDERYMNPDLTVIFTLDNQVRQQRIAKRGTLENPDTFESRGDEFQQKLNNGYAQIIAERNLPNIDAGQSIDDVQAAFRQLATPILRSNN